MNWKEQENDLARIVYCYGTLDDVLTQSTSNVFYTKGTVYIAGAHEIHAEIGSVFQIRKKYPIGPETVPMYF